MKFAKVILSAFLFLVTALPVSAQTTETYVVTPVNPQGWGFLAEGAAGKSSGSLVASVSGAPAGTGAGSLSTVDATGGHVLGTTRYAGTKLSDITALSYWSYGNLSPQSIALQFDVDSDVTDVNTTYQGRLVFEPYQGYGNAAVVPNTWTEWNALGGKWWGSGSGATRPVSVACPQSNPCTTVQLLSLFPNVGMRDPGALLFKVGSGWGPLFEGYVDKLTIAINSDDGVNTNIWDFEVFSVPTDIEQCKKGGYLLFNPPTGPYKNQGQCVSSVVSNAP